MLEHLHKCYEETETLGVGGVWGAVGMWGQKGLNKRGHGSNYFDIIMNAYSVINKIGSPLFVYMLGIYVSCVNRVPT